MVALCHARSVKGWWSGDYNVDQNVTESGIDEHTMTTILKEKEAESQICQNVVKELHTHPTTTTTDATLTLRNITLDRKSDLRKSWALILAYLLTEVTIQGWGKVNELHTWKYIHYFHP